MADNLSFAYLSKISNIDLREIMFWFERNNILIWNKTKLSSKHLEEKTLLNRVQIISNVQSIVEDQKCIKHILNHWLD